MCYRYTFSRQSGTVIALAITSQPPTAGFPLMQAFSTSLPKPFWVKISQMRTLSVERLSTKVGQVTPEELDQIMDGLNEIVGS